MVLGLASPEHCYAAIPQLELHAAQTYDASCCPQDGSPSTQELLSISSVEGPSQKPEDGHMVSISTSEYF